MIKAANRYTAEHMLACDDEFNKSHRVNFYIVEIIFCVLFAYFAKNVYDILRYSYHVQGMGILALFIAVIFLLNMKLLLNNLIKRRKIKKSPALPDRHTFIFNDDGFVMLTEKNGYASELYIGYSELDRVIENEKFFFVCQENQNIAVFGKNEFVDGSPDELRTLLYYKLGEKFEVHLY